jgi:methyltransferase NSUN6
MTLQVALLKPGGRLVYSTCTINPEENECNVAYALRTFPLDLIPAEPRCVGVCVHFAFRSVRCRLCVRACVRARRGVSSNSCGTCHPCRGCRIAPGGRAGCGLTEEERQMVQRFEPGASDLDTNGFFIAAFQKKLS